MDKTVLTIPQMLLFTGYTIILTGLVNMVFQWLKNKFDWFDATKKFRRENTYTQLKELYFNLYAIIAQSEYLRYFHNVQGTFDNIPFLEISNKKYETKINLSDGTVQKQSFNVKDAISEFNKESISQHIIDNGKYSSQNLLKLAVAYRYINKHYLDNTIDTDLLNKFQIEEVLLISKIVKTIIIETNKSLKTCKMDYDDRELNTGIMNYDIYGT